MTAIWTAGEALHDGALNEADRTELAAVITGEADRLSRLVDKLLDLSRLEAGTAEPRRDCVSLDEVVRGAVEHLAPAGAPVTVALEPDLPLVRADAVQLERVFVNLLENARRYSGGEPVQVRARVACRRALVRVIDHGPGISPDLRDRIFEPFEQGDDFSGHVGSGLGLAIVRGSWRPTGGGYGRSRFRARVPPSWSSCPCRKPRQRPRAPPRPERDPSSEADLRRAVDPGGREVVLGDAGLRVVASLRAGRDRGSATRSSTDRRQADRGVIRRRLNWLHAIFMPHGPILMLSARSRIDACTVPGSSLVHPIGLPGRGPSSAALRARVWLHRTSLERRLARSDDTEGDSSPAAATTDVGKRTARVGATKGTGRGARGPASHQRHLTPVCTRRPAAARRRDRGSPPRTAAAVVAGAVAGLVWTAVSPPAGLLSAGHFGHEVAWGGWG